MGLFVNIKSADTPASPVTADENNAMMIGKSTVIPTDNPFLAADIAKLDYYNIPTSAPIYKAAQNYFTHANGNGGLWLYVVSGAEQSESGVMLEGARDGSNTTLYAPYSPIVSVNKVECNFYSSGWKTVATGEYVTGEYDGSPDGSITFVSGITYIYPTGWVTGTETAWATGTELIPGAADYLRADLTYSPLGKGFNELLGDEMYYQFFTFAYDQTLTQSIDGSDTTKYASGKCYGGESWYDDVKIGKVMATNFNNVGKYPMFVAALPDSVLPNTVATGLYTSGASFDGERYSELRDTIGQEKYITFTAAKQATDGDDTSASFMGDCMASHPRTTMAAKSSSLGQTVFPKNPEILGWQAAHINPLINYAGVTMWFTGKTFGTGYEQEINYMRCLGIIKKKLRDDLLTRIMRRDLKYDLAGINSLINTISGTFKRLQAINIVDKGNIVITVPIKSYLVKEASLNAADKAYLATVRQSQLVKDITISFPWSGDIIYIEISSVLPN